MLAKSQIFLSHACGGELNDINGELINFFLSHACGGERCRVVSLGILVFLSHACGGEPIFAQILR